MSATDSPASWSDPRYVATVVGVLATAGIYVYSAATPAGPTTDEVTLVLLALLVPTTVAYEAARRWG